MIRTTAPGKVVLLGEYAVLEGATAVVAAVDAMARVSVAGVKADPTPHEPQGSDLSNAAADDPTAALSWVHAPDINVAGLPVDMAAAKRAAGAVNASALALQLKEQWQRLGLWRPQLSLVQGALAFAEARLAAAGHSSAPCRIDLDTRAFFAPSGGPKLGLGSSAALSSALVAALLAWGGLWPDAAATTSALAIDGGGSAPNRSDFLPTAWQAHRSIQGHGGSGVDVAASVLGGILRYQLVNEPQASQGSVRPQADPRPWPAALVPILVWSGHAASTGALVQRVRDWARAHPGRYRRLIEAMATVAAAGDAALAHADGAQFCAAFADYGSLLGRLGEAAGVPIWTPQHRAIHAWVGAAGGAYKPSGAGGGDVGVALAQGPEMAARVLAALAEENVTTMAYGWAATGLCVDVRG